MHAERESKILCWLIAITITRVSGLAWAENDGIEGYAYVQIGPSLGIADDSFDGDYEDIVGLNGRIGLRGEVVGFELHVEGMPGRIVKRSENSKRIGEDLVSVTANLKLFYDLEPFELYAVAGLGLLTLTEVIIVAALTGPDGETSSEDVKLDFFARAGLGLQFPVPPHVYGFLEGSWNGGSQGIER
jgi:hypothetical protein